MMLICYLYCVMFCITKVGHDVELLSILCHVLYYQGYICYYYFYYYYYIYFTLFLQNDTYMVEDFFRLQGQVRYLS